jgi:hypothetical protein
LPLASIERISITTKEAAGSIADLLHDLIGTPPGYLDKVKTVPTLLGKV